MKSDTSNIKRVNGENKKTLANNSTHDIEQSKNELTIEKLRSYDGFENIDESEAEDHIKLIKTFARVLYDIYQQENKK